MSLSSIFNISGSALIAETARLTTSAENMSNANVESGNPNEVYRAKYPIFQAIQEHMNQSFGNQMSGGVQLKGTYEGNGDPIKRYAPDNPLADKQGFVYTPNVNYVAEMANMISSSKSYQIDVEVLNSTKQLMQRTLQLGE